MSHRPTAALVTLVWLIGAGVAPAAVPKLPDSDTRAWWAITANLASDARQGRDTGSAAYEAAARWTAERFRRAGLKPAGDDGSFLQSVPMRQVDVDPATARVELVAADGTRHRLAFLEEVDVNASETLPADLTAGLAFRGYCGAEAMAGDLKGRIVVCFGNRRKGLPLGAERIANARKAGAVGVVTVDDAGFSLEPPRWPSAYARNVTLKTDPAAPAAAADLVLLRLSDRAFAPFIAGTGQDAAAILKAGTTQQPLPSFDLPNRLALGFQVTARDIRSPNVLGLLPGTDPALSKEVVVVSAHLDGYGFGHPVAGDALYNGAFDDAAYVATLIRLAERRASKGFRRTVLFAAFTGEEKGLLGAYWFTRHPTVPKADLTADINLDQLRPLFPLKILTMHAMDRSTLPETAHRVADPLGITLRPDLEPERNLLRRADQWPFLEIGVPATAFIFGFDPGTEAEARYRKWYQDRYHKPQDDMGQPFDPLAARDFNRFFYSLTGAVANQDDRPRMLQPAS
jgi:hypothetical protein